MTRARTRIFPDGWGDLPAASSSVHPIDIEWLDTRGSSSLEVLDGTFPSPAPLPRSAATGHVRWYRPRKARGVCVLLAASNEEGYGRRSALRSSPRRRRYRIPSPGEPLLRGTSGPRVVSAGTNRRRASHDGFCRRSGGAWASARFRGSGCPVCRGTPWVETSLHSSLRPIPILSLRFRWLLPRRLRPSSPRASSLTFVNWSSLACSRSELADVLDRVSVLALPPPVRPDLAIIVGARGDGYIPASAVESIHRHWAGSELRWEPGGHLSLATIGRQRLVRAIVDGFNRAV